MDVNHPFCFIFLLLALIHRQIDFLTYSDPKQDKISFFKKLLDIY